MPSPTLNSLKHNYEDYFYPKRSGSNSNLVQGRAHDGDEETVMEVVQELRADHGMCDLHHRITELQRVHKKHERRHADPVLPPQRMPVISSDFDLPGQRGVEGAEPRRQHLVKKKKKKTLKQFN